MLTVKKLFMKYYAQYVERPNTGYEYKISR